MRGAAVSAVQRLLVNGASDIAARATVLPGRFYEVRMVAENVDESGAVTYPQAYVSEGGGTDGQVSRDGGMPLTKLTPLIVYATTRQLIITADEAGTVVWVVELQDRASLSDAPIPRGARVSCGCKGGCGPTPSCGCQNKRPQPL